LAGRPDLQPGHSEVAVVTGLCGYLPLAIRLVAAGLRHHHAWTVTELAAELGTARDRLAAMQAEDVSVAAAFDSSYQELTAAHQQLFCRLGLHPGTDIDAYAAAALDGTDLQATRRRLGELHDQNLIGEPAAAGTACTTCSASTARARAGDAGEADNRACISRLLDFCLHASAAASRHTAWRTSVASPPLEGTAPAWAPGLRTEEETIAWLRTERSNLHACAGFAAAHGYLVHAVRIPVAMSGFLHIQGHWREALAVGQTALAAARTAGDRPRQAWALNQLGVVQSLTGNYPAATASLTRALQLFTDIGDKEGQGSALTHLGAVQQATGNCPAATASLTRALRLFRDLGDRHGQAGASISLAEILFLTSEYDQARRYFAQALDIAQDIGTPVEEARALEGIGLCRNQEESPGQGAEHLRRALAIYRRIGAPEAQRIETALLT
jgi:tetratricopeptide (TPR) repeat protein